MSKFKLGTKSSRSLEEKGCCEEHESSKRALRESKDLLERQKKKKVKSSKSTKSTKRI